MGEVDDDDAALVAQVRAGEPAAFARLVQRYHPSLVRLAGSVTSRRALAEDAAQETWVAVLRGIDGFEGRSTVRAWLFQICVNRARSLAAREARLVPIAPHDLAGGDHTLIRSAGACPLWSTIAEPDARPADDLQLVARVRTAIHRLPAAQRRVVTLRDVAGWPADQVCAALGLSDANQRVLLHRGRRGVQRALAG